MAGVEVVAPVVTALTAAVGVVGIERMEATASMAVEVLLAIETEVETLPMAEQGVVAITVAPAPLGGPVAVKTAAAAVVLAM